MDGRPPARIRKVRALHQCPQCPKRFTKRSNMLIHARLHTGERPYVCKYAGCGRSYKWLSSINFHHGLCDKKNAGLAVPAPKPPPPPAAAEAARVAAVAAAAAGDPTAAAAPPLPSHHPFALHPHPFQQQMQPLPSYQILHRTTQSHPHTPGAAAAAAAAAAATAAAAASAASPSASPSPSPPATFSPQVSTSPPTSAPAAALPLPLRPPHAQYQPFYPLLPSSNLPPHHVAQHQQMYAQDREQDQDRERDRDRDRNRHRDQHRDPHQHHFHHQYPQQQHHLQSQQQSSAFSNALLPTPSFPQNASFSSHPPALSPSTPNQQQPHSLFPHTSLSPNTDLTSTITNDNVTSTSTPTTIIQAATTATGEQHIHTSSNLFLTPPTKGKRLRPGMTPTSPVTPRPAPLPHPGINSTTVLTSYPHHFLHQHPHQFQQQPQSLSIPHMKPPLSGISLESLHNSNSYNSQIDKSSNTNERDTTHNNSNNIYKTQCNMMSEEGNREIRTGFKKTIQQTLFPDTKIHDGSSMNASNDTDNNLVKNIVGLQRSMKRLREDDVNNTGEAKAQRRSASLVSTTPVSDGESLEKKDAEGAPRSPDSATSREVKEMLAPFGSRLSPATPSMTMVTTTTDDASTAAGSAGSHTGSDATTMHATISPKAEQVSGTAGGTTAGDASVTVKLEHRMELGDSFGFGEDDFLMANCSMSNDVFEELAGGDGYGMNLDGCAGDSEGMSIFQ